MYSTSLSRLLYARSSSRSLQPQIRDLPPSHKIPYAILLARPMFSGPIMNPATNSSVNPSTSPPPSRATKGVTFAVAIVPTFEEDIRGYFRELRRDFRPLCAKATTPEQYRMIRKHRMDIRQHKADVKEQIRAIRQHAATNRLLTNTERPDWNTVSVYRHLRSIKTSLQSVEDSSRSVETRLQAILPVGQV
jgi:hypothetical protein